MRSEPEHNRQCIEHNRECSAFYMGTTPVMKASSDLFFPHNGIVVLQHLTESFTKFEIQPGIAGLINLLTLITGIVLIALNISRVI